MTPSVSPPHGVYILSPTLEQLSWVGGGEASPLGSMEGREWLVHFLSPFGQAGVEEGLFHSLSQSSALSPSNCRWGPNLSSTKGEQPLEAPQLHAPS